MAAIEHDAIVAKQLFVGGKQTGPRTGRPAEFFAQTNVTMGSFFNAAKSYLDLDSSGAVTGLGSAHNSEMRLPSGGLSGIGSYGVHEYELVTQAGGTTGGAPVAFQWFQVSGDGSATTDWENTGFFFILKGMTDGNAKIFSAGSTDKTVKATLRVLIGSTTYYLMLTDSATS